VSAHNSPGIVLLEEIARKTAKETGEHVPLQLFVVRNDSMFEEASEQTNGMGNIVGTPCFTDTVHAELGIA
jgi:hypothetical protein